MLLQTELTFPNPTRAVWKPWICIRLRDRSIGYMINFDINPERDPVNKLPEIVSPSFPFPSHSKIHINPKFYNVLLEEL